MSFVLLRQISVLNPGVNVLGKSQSSSIANNKDLVTNLGILRLISNDRVTGSDSWPLWFLALISAV